MTILDDIRRYFAPHLWARDEPTAHAPIQYDPQFGFEDRPGDRSQIVPTATFAEMESCGIEERLRDECVHLHIAYRNCMRSNVPFAWRCTGFKNEIKNCYFERRIREMKEFERERRLNIRERKLREQSI